MSEGPQGWFPRQAAAAAGQNWPITGSTGALTSQQEDQLHAGHDVDDLSNTIMSRPAAGRPCW